MYEARRKTSECQGVVMPIQPLSGPDSRETFLARAHSVASKRVRARAAVSAGSGGRLYGERGGLVSATPGAPPRSSLAGHVPANNRGPAPKTARDVLAGRRSRRAA